MPDKTFDITVLVTEERIYRVQAEDEYRAEEKLWATDFKDLEVIWDDEVDVQTINVTEISGKGVPVV